MDCVNQNILDFDKHVLTLAQHFVSMKYLLDLPQQAAARSKDRTRLLTPQATEDDEQKDKIYLITTYNPTDTEVPKMVRKKTRAFWVGTKPHNTCTNTRWCVVLGDLKT